MPRLPRFELVTRAALRRLAVLAIALGLFGAVLYSTMIRMPGKSYRGALRPLTDSQTALRDRLRADLHRLAGEIGERNVVAYAELRASADFVQSSLEGAGYRVERQGFEAFGRRCDNLVAERRGTVAPDDVVVVGAHYDSVEGSPGANDNGSGAVALLALARAFSGAHPEKTLRFAAFVNEEPPHFLENTMGSRVYAKACRARGERIVAMLSLETIGYYSREEGSQRYPMRAIGLAYPTAGDFIAFVGNVASRALVRRAVASFRAEASFPSEGAALPGWVPGVGWSDHSSFWEVGYPALMVTDTAPFRYPHYHQPSDTPDRVDYDSLARVVSGLVRVVADLSGTRPRAP
jgi:hypothetical protein